MGRFIHQNKQDTQGVRELPVPTVGKHESLEKIAQKAKHYRSSRGLSEEFLSYEFEHINARREAKFAQATTSDKEESSKGSNSHEVPNVTTSQIKNEFLREERLIKRKSFIKRFVGLMLVVVAISAIISTFFISILQIRGTSMEPLLNPGDNVLALHTHDLGHGELIAFHQGNKILVKRVIATAGDWVDIRPDGTVFVNNKELREEYITKFSLGTNEIEYPTQVPDNHYFVLGDSREKSLDSRTQAIGMVSKEDVLGRVVVSLVPWKVL